MSQDIEPFVHVPSLRTVICKECQYGCAADVISSHLRSPTHKLRTAEDRQRIADAIQRIPDIFRSQVELCGFQFPPPEFAANPLLTPAQNDGMACPRCGYVCRTEKGKEGHNRQCHAENDVVADVQWRVNVRCQKMFKSREGSRWFEVERPIDITAAVGNDGQSKPETMEQRFVRITQQRADMFANSQQGKVVAGDESLEPNLWLRRVGWAEHLAHCDPKRLRESIGPSRDDEPVLQAVKSSFHRVISAAKLGSMRRSIGLQVLFEVNRKEGHIRPRKPFDSIMASDAWVRYKAVWWKVLCYLFRTQDWDDEERPLYELTVKQSRLFDELEAAAENTHASDVDTKRMDRLCLDLMIAILDHQWKENEYECVIISALAVMGMREDGGWVTAEDYTPVYSAVIKLARMLVIHQAVQERADDIARFRPSMEEREAKERARSVPEIVRKAMTRFMVLSSAATRSGPMEFIFEARSYGLKIRYTTVAPGKIDWSGEQVTYQKSRFTMTRLCDMMHNIAAEAKEIMGKLIMMPESVASGESFPTIDWARMEDDHSEDRMGYSFMSDERNQWAADGQMHIRNRVVADEALRREWIQDADQPYRAKAVHRYSQLVKDFRQRLLMLMHMSSGAPGRGPEILGIRFRNTAHGGIRNIFAHNGMMCFVTSYHKNYRSSEQVKVIHRYLPREVGELLVWYLWMVLPFWQQVQGCIQNSTETSPFLWADSVVCPKPVEAGEVATGDRPMVAGEAPMDEMQTNSAAHEDFDEEMSTSHGIWGQDRLRRIIQQHSQRLLRSPLNISTWRHIATAITRRYLQPGGAEKPDEDEDEGYFSDSEDDNIFDLQSGHGTHVAGMVYARELQQGQFGTAARRDMFRRASIRWHRFLTMGDRDGGARLNKRRADVFEEAQEQARHCRFKKLCTMDIRGQLRQMMGEDAEFRGIQEPVIKAIMNGLTPIVQVTGTGGGKSLSFMLPAYCSGVGVTVVIVPLVALRDDLLQRCEELQIDVRVWEGERSAQAASIVLVTPESAVTKGFQSFITRLRARGQLDRVFVDECHMVLDAGDGFRPQMRTIGSVIAGFGVQTVWLTATLAPRDEEEFYRVTEIDRRRVRMFRARTTRKNIRYRVRETGGADIEAVVCQEVMKALKTDSEGKIIVYGGTIARTDSLATTLAKTIPCKAYHSSIGNNEQKKEIMRAWIEEGRVIVATNALGVGLDIPNVRSVIHAGSPRKLRDYAQESGRGGRDGQANESVIVCHVRNKKEREAETARKWKDPREADIIELIEGHRCRRVVLDEVMDGRVDRVACEGDEELCDHCRREQSPFVNTTYEEERFIDSGLYSGIETSSIHGAHDTDSDSGSVDSIISYTASSPPIRRSSVPSMPNTQSTASTQHTQQDGTDILFDAMVRNTKWQEEKSRQKISKEAQEADRFIEKMMEWQGVCVICRMDDADDDEHALENCPHKAEAISIRVQKDVEMLTKSIFGQKKVEPFAGCYHCGWPQELCPSWASSKDDGGHFKQIPGVDCDKNGMLIQTIAGFVKRRKDRWNEMKEAVYKEVEGVTGKEVFIEWAGRKCRIGRLQTMYLCRMWYKVVQEIDGF